MTRDPNIPDAFDVYTLVILRRPTDAPTFTDSELEELQAGHLAYRAGLAREGVLVVNGPVLEQTDPMIRGISIFACGPDEAAQLNDGDPMVVAHRLRYEVMEWWVGAGTLAFPGFDGEVGTRRSMTD